MHISQLGKRSVTMLLLSPLFFTLGMGPPGGGGGNPGDCVPTGNGPPLPVIAFDTSEINTCNASAADCRELAERLGGQRVSRLAGHIIVRPVG